MPQLIILRGVPGSGKTTWAREYCEEYPNAVRVNKDDLRAMLFDGQYSLTNEQIVEAAQAEIIRVAAGARRRIVVDNTNVNPERVRELTELAKEIAYTVRIKDFDTPLEECIRRDGLRPHPIGAARIRKMWDRLQAQK